MPSPKPEKRAVDDSFRAWMEQSNGDPRRLAKLLRPTKKLFSTADLGQILAHQLASPLKFHWGALNSRLDRELDALSEEKRLVLRTFGDLLRQSSPPGGLLLLLKDFAKGMLKHPDALLPEKLASVLYFTAIAAGKMQGLESISELDDASIRQGISWALEQTWLGEPCRGVLEKGLRKMNSRGGSSGKMGAAP